MPHPNEESGIKMLIEHLKNSGHQVQRIKGTFDLEVDGQCAEVKTKEKSFSEIDFISLTQKQQEAANDRGYDIYLVCGVQTNAPEFFRISSRALIAKKPRVITSYEYDKRLLKDLAERI
jgi:hypothetical protein